MGDQMTELGTRLRQARKDRGLSQKQLADCAGLVQSAISAFEAGEKEPRISTLQQLASCLQISTALLLGESELVP
jgi:transcriptional regulator with XRE-family HTH domain